MMVVPAWLRKRLPSIALSKTKRSYLLTDQEFRLAVARERMRSDRSQSQLAILVIELPEGRKTPRDVARLSRVLRKRLRFTDVAGHLADGLVVVLLPDTPKAGAWKVASDLCDFYPVGHDRPNCEVYIYPDEYGSSDNKSSLHRDDVSQRTSRQLESLFALPMPMMKRVVDVVGALCGLVLTAPLILLFGIIIKLTSPGPVFFSHLREGHGGRRFPMFKLRSMRVGAELEQAALRAESVQDGPAFKMWHDPRTTWIGRFMRCTSLDELPQLWNVLIGDMSLVGPRPLPVAESQQCQAWQRRRLSVVPGLTCVWQVRGRSMVSFEDWMRMDIEYLQRQSLFYDVRLMLSTLPTLVLRQGPR
jgi:lipopolysaccharide/colanic/teichoic acid biosynthesis glycosyltransferase